MKRARRLPKDSRDLCEACVSDQVAVYRRRGGDQSIHCKVRATVEIAGQELCGKHAGQAALRLLLAESQ